MPYQPSWRPDVKQAAYEYRAQGLTCREIEAELSKRFGPHDAPGYVTVSRWMLEPSASGLIEQAATRIRAHVAVETADNLAGVYAGLREAIEQRDAKAVDNWTRSIVGLTRGFVAERVELTPPKTVDGDAELANLLARHGVSVAQPPDKTTETRGVIEPAADKEHYVK